MSRYLFWYHRPNLQHNDLQLIIFHNIILLHRSFPILVDKTAQGQEIPRVEVPRTTKTNYWNLELVSRAHNILVAFLCQASAIGEYHVQLNEYLSYGALHQVSYIFISACDILALRALDKLRVIRVQVDTLLASLS